eukprot:jgi/Tetstr1/442755/TSEL_030843.t1
MAAADSSVLVGVLALQGSFREHVRMIEKISGASAIEVRTKEELNSVDGLIIPGGESTTMALIAQEWGLLTELQEFAKTGKPIWGTCAGLIFPRHKLRQKEGGQALIGGLDVEVHRNFFGSQIHSFEAALDCPEVLPDAPGFDRKFRAVFIRAPAIVEVSDAVEVLGRYFLTAEERKQVDVESVVVAVRQGGLMATAFHPEITSDPRWHMLFVEMVAQSAQAGVSATRGVPELNRVMSKSRPADMPVY